MVCIVSPVSKEKLEKTLGVITDEEYENYVWEKSVPQDAIDPIYVDNKIIPTDRYFRNSWEFKKDINKIEINLEKAKKIHLDKLREKRTPILEKLDKDFMIKIGRAHV